MTIHSKPWAETLGGHLWWTVIRSDKEFIMQEHKMPGLWPFSYRIISRNGSGLAASANSRTEIEMDWDVLHDI